VGGRRSELGCLSPALSLCGFDVSWFVALRLIPWRKDGSSYRLQETVVGASSVV
jgi:hypothetical protein